MRKMPLNKHLKLNKIKSSKERGWPRPPESPLDPQMHACAFVIMTKFYQISSIPYVGRIKN